MSDWDEFVAEKKGKVLRLEPPPSKAKNERPSMADLFASQAKQRRLPAFSREFMFAKVIKRNWRFDFAFGYPGPWKIAVEIEGVVMRRVDGHWQIGGRHASIQGFKEDCVKYNTAALLGWTVLRFEQSQVKSDYAIETTMRLLVRNGWNRDRDAAP